MRTLHDPKLKSKIPVLMEEKDIKVKDFVLGGMSHNTALRLARGETHMLLTTALLVAGILQVNVETLLEVVAE